ncbi:unnamed protein product, partial [Ixodes pacificus]
GRPTGRSCQAKNVGWGSPRRCRFVLFLPASESRVDGRTNEWIGDTMVAGTCLRSVRLPRPEKWSLGFRPMLS